MLRELQQDFYRGLFRGEEGVLRHIAPGPALSAAETFAIYRGSVSAGLTGALAAVYPVCLRLVGGRFFQALAEGYIRRSPSCSPDLTDYGGGFAAFVAGHPAATGLPYLPDVARLEWAWHRAFNAPDPPPMDLLALAAVSAEAQAGIVFSLAPGSGLIESVWPVHRIWETNQADYRGDDTVSLDEGGVRCLVCRQGLEMHIQPLGHTEWMFLQAVGREEPLGRILAEIATAFPDPAVEALPGDALARGWITSFRVG